MSFSLKDFCMNSLKFTKCKLVERIKKITHIPKHNYYLLFDTFTLVSLFLCV